MWKVGAAVAVLLLILVGIQFWPRAHRTEAQPRTARRQLAGAAVRTCARQVMNDWVRDARIRGYRRECYQAALNMISGGDRSCETAYGGIGELCDELHERLRVSG